MENTYHSEIKGLQTLVVGPAVMVITTAICMCFGLPFWSGFGSISATYIGFIVFSSVDLLLVSSHALRSAATYYINIIGATPTQPRLSTVIGVGHA